MSQEVVGIEEPSPPWISEKDRRWAILRWLSEKLPDAPHGEILEAAKRFEEFVAGEVAGKRVSKEAISKIEGIESTASKIVGGAAEVKSDFEQ